MFRKALLAAALAVASATAAYALEPPAGPVQVGGTVNGDWPALFTVDTAAPLVVLPRALVEQMAHSGGLRPDDVIDPTPGHLRLRLRSMWVPYVELDGVIATVTDGPVPVLGRSFLDRLSPGQMLVLQRSEVGS
jgi:hypothetical protein